jgi:hypothetical protein
LLLRAFTVLVWQRFMPSSPAIFISTNMRSITVLSKAGLYYIYTKRNNNGILLGISESVCQ